VILLGEKLIGARSAFLERFLAVALEHQAGCARCRSPESWQELAYRPPACDPALSPHSPDEAAILSALTAVRD
jgi:hypothetical protein